MHYDLIIVRTYRYMHYDLIIVRTYRYMHYEMKYWTVNLTVREPSPERIEDHTIRMGCITEGIDQSEITVAKVQQLFTKCKAADLLSLSICFNSLTINIYVCLFHRPHVHLDLHYCKTTEMVP